MSTLRAFSEKERAYHQYQARQNYLRQQLSLQKQIATLCAEIEQIHAEKEQARVTEERKPAEIEQIRAEKEAALAEIARLKALFQDEKVIFNQSTSWASG